MAWRWPTSLDCHSTRCADQAEGPSANWEAVKSGVYWISCSCGKAYISEARRRLTTRLKEHRDTCQKGTLEKSAIAACAWENHHPIKWEEAAVVDQARCPKELLLKGAIHIQTTPAEEHFNKNMGLMLPGCWMAALRSKKARINQGRPSTSSDAHWWTVNSNDTRWGDAWLKNAVFTLTSTFTLQKTKAFCSKFRQGF